MVQGPMATSEIDTAVIGAGQAGLAMSRWLQLRGITHVVLERGRVGNSWRTQRWDSFMLNTPNLVNQLPGDTYQGDDPVGFAPCDELLRYFEQYRARHELPVREGVEVTSVRQLDGGFEVEANGERRTYRHVVLCTGDQNNPRLLALADRLDSSIVQMHAADYRRPNQLPQGAVLVVGSGQSGAQITEDLLEAGREVYLSTSGVGRIPRRYRGKDIVEWMLLVGMAEHTPADLEDENEIYSRQPQTSGTRGGHSVSLHQLAREGAKLLGRLSAVEGRLLRFDDDLLANAKKGDQACAKIKGGLDLFVQKTGTQVPAAELDPADVPFEGLAEMASVRELDLDARAIRSVVWATGFGPKFDYLDPALLDEGGLPRHTEGVCTVPGLFCVGLVWQRRRISGLLAGVDRDAEYISQQIAERRFSS